MQVIWARLHKAIRLLARCRLLTDGRSTAICGATTKYAAVGAILVLSSCICRLAEAAGRHEWPPHPFPTACCSADLQERLADTSADNPFNIAVESWVRQRAYALWAVQELGEH